MNRDRIVLQRYHMLGGTHPQYGVLKKESMYMTHDLANRWNLQLCDPFRRFRNGILP